MMVIFYKEIKAFFSSLIGYIAIGVFLLLLGLLVWVFPDTSILDYGYATLDPMFELAPVIFLFLIPAVTMRAYAEEWQTGTYELLVTRPVTSAQIILAKFFASFILVIIALLPTLVYWLTAYQLASPVGNLDQGAIMGSYVGLACLGGVFVAIGLFTSAMTNNQIVAFLLGILLCFLVYWGFSYFSRIPVFIGRWDDVIQQFGIEYHYASISRGVIDSRDIIYFLSVISAFLLLTAQAIHQKKG
ncbi:MAG: gliding motility-associated ABC transporter permease subunit GldF [Lewinellaceae bacterium]|nr:gliding motility-associated ABC transporter permease subunit GldF [Saprospiraceae bacterium]MCB9311757.1 gliding motility-associated ABC transporter permease subunit GldF [Lewinellaceae bacterium]